MSGVVLALRNTIIKTVYPQGTYALERSITTMSLVFRFMDRVTQANRIPVLYTDNHHITRNSKS